MKLAALTLAGAFTQASAAIVTPISYDMPNGEIGSFTYFDESYSGSGNTAVSDALLAGGLGDLTDGVLATAHWYDQPGPYVGWAQVVPEIVFHFASATAFTAATFYFDEQYGTGYVYLPTSIEFDTGAGFQTYAPTITSVGPLAKYDFDLTGALTSTITARLNHPAGQTVIMLTEVTFDGTSPTPEPAMWATMLAGFGLVGGALRRRRRALPIQA